MRKGTLWVVLALTTALFVLIAYYLLPLWWARLVNVWVGATSSWVTGLLLGFIPVTIGTSAFLGALRPFTPRRNKAEEAHGAGHYARIALGAVAGFCLATVVLTVLVAAGVSEPLREARSFWQDSAPGVLVATLVGALLGVIAILGVYAVVGRVRQGKTVRALNKKPAPPEDPQREGGP